MARSFRFDPPAPRIDLLTRPRLLRALLDRWDHPAVAIVGGPGLGKTTLLAQAVAENRLAPRGEDVWIGVETRDADGESLARAVATAIRTLGPPGSSGRGGATDRLEAVAVAESLWPWSPAAVCLVFDDVHLLPPGSPGARWLAELVEALPANGHVLLAGRTEPPLPVRLRATGALRLVAEDDLRFSGDELAGFASRRGLAAADLTDTGGWPAMAELTASAVAADGHLAGAYVWEEVLEPLGPERRRVLSVVGDIGGADDDLAAAALGTPVDLRATFHGVPLVAAGDDGWRIPHPLWRTVPALVLPAAERSEARRRAVDHLVGRRRFEEALALVVEIGQWDQAPDVLRAACVASDKPTSGQLRRWLDACPAEVHASPAGRLAAGLHAAFVTPGEAVAPLRAAVEACRTVDDVDGELAALAELGRVAWWSQNQAALASVAPRVGELSRAGHPLARGLDAFGRAVVADVLGDDPGVLAALDSIEDGVLDPGWAASARWLRARITLSIGDVDGALALIDQPDGPGPGPAAGEAGGVTDPVMRSIFAALRTGALWAQGRVDEVLARLVRSLDTHSMAGVEHNRHMSTINAAGMAAHVGRTDLARTFLATLGWSEPFRPSGALGEGFGDRKTVLVAMTVAELHLADGDEAAARAVLEAAVAEHGVDRGTDRRTWRSSLCMVYVLVPGTRAHWDAIDLHGILAVQRDLARAVVAVRAAGASASSDAHRAGRAAAGSDGPRGLRAGRGAGTERQGAGAAVPDEDAEPGAAARGVSELPDLETWSPPDPQVVRAALPFRLVVELAVGLDARGRPEGALLLDALGPVGRDVLRELGSVDDDRAVPARALLAAVPAPPIEVTRVGVLGPLVMTRGAAAGADSTGEVTDPDLRRERVRTLLAFLVSHRRTTRTAILAALWPDLDERSGANNLRVTLNYLLRVLEPQRPAGEPSYLVRVDGARVELVAGDHLRIDADDFGHHLDAATRAERDGAPSSALDHLLAAADLYRGDLHAEVPDAEWVDLDREHYRSRFVTAAVRAAQLLVGRGDADQAERMAQRALAVDPWAEDAFGVLVVAALARGDRSAARRQLERCTTALAELGVEPSDATRRLRRRVRGS